jgi:RraA family protein
MTTTRSAIIDSTVAGFATVPAANVGDAQERFGIAVGLAPVWRGARLVGRARTVWTRSGDNLYIHKALDVAQPGEVIVVNGHGDLSRALIGDLIGLRARSLGIAGFVIDGAVRDADALKELGLPVFARGITPAGPYKHGPGRLDVPIAVGGVVVSPGDLVVADADGVVIVHADDVEAVLDAALAIEAGEVEKRALYS